MFRGNILKLFLAGILCVGLCACGKDLPVDSETQSENNKETAAEIQTQQEETAVTESVSSEMTEDMQVINPLQEVTFDELVAQTGIPLYAPEGADEVRYFVLAYDDVMIAQMKFSWNGAAAYLRAQATSALEAEDISGLNYQWAATGETQVGYCAATTYLKDGVGYIAWLDVVPGIVYNLCMTEGADAYTLSELANAVFVPVQGEAEGDAPD